MENEPEVIRQQMEETRSSLQDKLEVLEQQVLNTMQEANQTVEAVKETVEAVKESVQDTATTVKETVQGTVESVKDSVHDTVQTVKETLDVERQVRAHPWAMVIGATACGFVAGKVLHHLMAPPSVAARMATAPQPYVGTAGLSGPSHAFRDRERMDDRARMNGGSSTRPEQPRQPNWLTQLTQSYRSEIDKAKALAISTAGSLARDLINKSVAPPIGEKINEIVDSVTMKLGGQPLEGSILDDYGGRKTPATERQTC
jgi:ElaB/YqjD/DUF883 family membrane-anchored ribosome-binding protein